MDELIQAKIIQERIDILGTYTEDEALEEFDILHLYPLENAYPDGFVDAKFFRLVGFNCETQRKRDLGRRDQLELNDFITTKVAGIRIYVDGSTMIKFAGMVKVKLYKSAEVRPA
jgi:hypothetical protein